MLTQYTICNYLVLLISSPFFHLTLFQISAQVTFNKLKTVEYIYLTPLPDLSEVFFYNIKVNVAPCEISEIVNIAMFTKKHQKKTRDGLN